MALREERERTDGDTEGADQGDGVSADASRSSRRAMGVRTLVQKARNLSSMAAAGYRSREAQEAATH